LATQRLVTASQEIACEGWSWIETRTRRDYNELFGFARLRSRATCLPGRTAS